MYCSKCGQILDENGKCPRCDAEIRKQETSYQPGYAPQPGYAQNQAAGQPAQPGYTQNQPYYQAPAYNPNNYVPPKPKAPKDPAKCAWFAPVAVVACYFLRGIIGSIPTWIYSRSYSYHGYSFNFVNSIVALIVNILALAACGLLYFLATKDCEKSVREKCIAVAAVPFLCIFIHGYLSSVITSFFLLVLSEAVSYSVITVISGVLSFILAAVLPVVSMLAAKKLFEKLSKK